MTTKGIAAYHLSEPFPLIMSVPHGGTHFPRAMRTALTMPATSLWSDWDTAELYNLGADSPIPLVTTGLSRFVADPNRTPIPPLHGDFWSTAVPARDPSGVGLYDRELTEPELHARLELAHVPYHQALDAAINLALRRHRNVLLLDLHSFGMPLEVDVILGDGDGTTASSAASDRVEAALRNAGFSVARNLRFTGGYIIRRWAESERVDAVQLELNQRRYLHVSDVEGNRPQPRRNPSGWARTRRAIRATTKSLAVH
jgi:N-formylglutamate amidohydrolase